MGEEEQESVLEVEFPFVETFMGDRDPALFKLDGIPTADKVITGFHKIEVVTQRSRDFFGVHGVNENMAGLIFHELKDFFCISVHMTIVTQ